MSADIGALAGDLWGGSWGMSWGDLWRRWAQTRQTRMLFADWQAIYPDLEVVSIDELVDNGVAAYFLRMGNSDDEVLSLLFDSARRGMVMLSVPLRSCCSDGSRR